MMPHSHT
jgi:hypothetical protein